MIEVEKKFILNEQDKWRLTKAAQFLDERVFTDIYYDTEIFPLTAKASAKPSKIEVTGLFADEKIPKGTVTWRFNPSFDILFDPEEIKQMPPEHRELIDRYAYLSTTTGKFVYSIDDSRFTNHSSVKNTIDVVPSPGEPETLGVANRDIEKGEEMLVNYRAFDAHDENSKEEYLNH